MKILIVLLIALVSFLATAFCFWLLTLLLPVFGIALTFSWGKALAFWVILIIIRALLKSTVKVETK